MTGVGQLGDKLQGAFSAAAVIQDDPTATDKNTRNRLKLLEGLQCIQT